MNPWIFKVQYREKNRYIILWPNVFKLKTLRRRCFFQSKYLMKLMLPLKHFEAVCKTAKVGQKTNGVKVCKKINRTFLLRFFFHSIYDAGGDVSFFKVCLLLGSVHVFGSTWIIYLPFRSFFHLGILLHFQNEPSTRAEPNAKKYCAKTSQIVCYPSEGN